MYEIVFEPSDLNMLAAIGIIEKAKLFPYLLSMGDLRHPCDSCYRCEQFIKCLSEYCTDCKSQAKKLWEKYHTTEDIIQDAMMNQKSLRIWVRNTSECWCGIYYICFCAAKRHSANISLAWTLILFQIDAPPQAPTYQFVYGSVSFPSYTITLMLVAASTSA